MPRKPQINFQCVPALRRVYDDMWGRGFRPARWCAAGLLWMIEHPREREDVLQRLRDWERGASVARPRDTM